jgi:hypothetical protein
MTSAGAGVQPGTGTAISSAGTAADAFDGNSATWWYAGFGATDNAWIGYNFDVDQEPTHLSLKARNDAGCYQSPRVFWVERSTDGGASWLPVRYIIAAPWTIGATQVFNLYSDGYASADLSALDEVGGYRYWAFEVTGDNYGGSYPCYQVELVLRKSGAAFQTAFHQHRQSGFNNLDIGRPCDGVASDEFFAMGSGAYLIVDFGYKRAVDQVGVTHRTFADGVQGLQTYNLLAANSFSGSTWTLAEMSVIKAVHDTGANPPGPGASVLFSVP